MGMKKSNCIREFLTLFIHHESGMVFNEQNYVFKIRAIIVDSHAKAFVKHT